LDVFYVSGDELEVVFLLNGCFIAALLLSGRGKQQQNSNNAAIQQQQRPCREVSIRAEKIRNKFYRASVCTLIFR
jgi:hypothetical protein